MRVLCLCAIAFALVAHPPERLAAQGGSPPKCDKPEFRQFDFWVGDWDVTVGGHQAGTNQVTLEEDGCVIHEHWKGVREKRARASTTTIAPTASGIRCGYRTVETCCP